MSKKKSKGEDEAGQAPAEESQVRPDEVADVKPKKKGKADEGAASVDVAKNAVPHPEEAAKPKPKMELKDYERELARLEIELVKLQEWIKVKGLKVVVIFEGRDAAGKGGTIKTITESLNPRICRVVALGIPTEREKSQWYFQRYVAHLPAGGEMVLFDRSWYNRAGVERVMGFCTEDEYREFLRSCPEFERMLMRGRHHPDQILVLCQRRRAGAPVPRTDGRTHQALEDQPDGCAVTLALGGILEGQGCHVRVHRHQAGALVCGQFQ